MNQPIWDPFNRLLRQAPAQKPLAEEEDEEESLVRGTNKPVNLAAFDAGRTETQGAVDYLRGRLEILTPKPPPPLAATTGSRLAVGNRIGDGSTSGVGVYESVPATPQRNDPVRDPRSSMTGLMGDAPLPTAKPSRYTLVQESRTPAMDRAGTLNVDPVKNAGAITTRARSSVQSAANTAPQTPPPSSSPIQAATTASAPSATATSSGLPTPEAVQAARGSEPSKAFENSQLSPLDEETRARVKRVLVGGQKVGYGGVPANLSSSENEEEEFAKLGSSGSTVGYHNSSADAASAAMRRPQVYNPFGSRDLTHAN